MSYCQAATVCTLISLLYLSRAVYNIIAVSPSSLPTFNFGWINVSDQVGSCMLYFILYIFSVYSFLILDALLIVEKGVIFLFSVKAV